jgi:uncharacterized protein YaeQ
VALSSTVYTLEVDLAHGDRGVYETLSLRVARHPSESEEFFIARVLAYCCEYSPGIEFSAGGLSNPDDPPIAVRDLTGALVAWVDIGTPAADRLHRASKAAARVAVYVHREASQWLDGLRSARVHRAEALELYALDRDLVGALVAKLDRRMSLAVSIAEGEIFAAFDDGTLSGQLTRLRL